MGKKKNKKKSEQEIKKARFMRTQVAAEKKAEKEKKRPFKVKRIRMLMSVANEKVAFTAGAVYKVGVEITPETAESYVRTGVAEEDMSLDVPEEIKETITHPVGKLTEEPVTTSGEQEVEIEGEKIVGVVDPEKEKDEEAPKDEEKEEEPPETKVEEPPETKDEEPGEDKEEEAPPELEPISSTGKKDKQ